MNMEFGIRLFHGKFIRFMSGSEKHILVNFCECRDDPPPTQDCCGGHSVRLPFPHTFVLFLIA